MLLQKTIRLTKNQKGLTLIELLAIIVILGIIAAIAIPTVGTLIENSRTNADIRSVELIEGAALLYLVANDSDTLRAGTEITVATLNTAGYLNSIPESQVLKEPYVTVTYSHSPTAGYTVTEVVKPTP